MNKKIELENIKQVKKDNNIEINFELSIGDKKNELWYKIECVDCNLEDKLSENFDSIVITFLLFAMMNGYDFVSKYPISEKLYYQLIYHVIPQIKRCNPNDTFDIEIHAPLYSEVSINDKINNYVATGISCGVDSLTTIYEYTDLCKLDNYKLTHLVYFKTGAHDGQIGRFDKNVENKLFQEQLSKAKEFCKKINYPLIIVDSNLNEILSNNFGFTNYDRTHSFRSCGTMMLLQKYFSKYYYADAYSLDGFCVDINKSSAHYEKWLLPLISNENINFYSANKNMTRFEKTKLLTNYEYSYDNLLVCGTEKANCGTCPKCIRTQITLDVLDKLELYKNSFDLDKFNKNKEKYYKDVIINRKYDDFYKEIFNHMNINKSKVFMYDSIYFVRRIISKTLKILRIKK